MSNSTHHHTRINSRKRRGGLAIFTVAAAMVALSAGYSAQAHTVPASNTATHFRMQPPPPFSSPDAVIRDCAADDGTEPDVLCSSIYNSPDIVVRNLNDNGGLSFQMQNPIAGNPAWVFVRIKNNGAASLVDGLLHVYVAASSTGFLWPTSWTGTPPLGYEITAIPATVPVIAPGGTVIVGVPWGSVPDPYALGPGHAAHYCLLARLESNDDPICSEVSYTQQNARNCNNIAWRNLDGIDPHRDVAKLTIRNLVSETRNTRINFDVDPSEEPNHALANCDVEVDLGDMYPLWQAGGALSSGITTVTGTIIQVTAPHAWIGGIPLGPDEQHTIDVTFSNFNTENASGIFHWDIVQHDEDEGEDVGGEAYEIHMQDSKDVGGDQVPKMNFGPQGSTALAAALGLAAHPNPTGASTAISYKLPVATQVTVTIYDAAGRVVRTLLPAGVQNAGAHEIVWDGTSENTRRVPSGLYFYRLATLEGTAEGQITVVR